MSECESNNSRSFDGFFSLCYNDAKSRVSSPPSLALIQRKSNLLASSTWDMFELTIFFSLFFLCLIFWRRPAYIFLTSHYFVISLTNKDCIVRSVLSLDGLGNRTEVMIYEKVLFLDCPRVIGCCSCCWLNNLWLHRELWVVRMGNERKRNSLHNLQ